MKRPQMLSCIFCLVAGLLVGGILPMPWDKTPAPAVNSILLTPNDASSQNGAGGDACAEPMDAKDNFSLLNSACYVLHLLKEEDYAALSNVVHPERGVTFTPYSTVDFTSDRIFDREQIKNLAEDDAVYTWGITDGRGSLINLTMTDYFARYVFDTDYTQAAQIGVDQILMTGNALENLTDAYPDCRFVDFLVPGRDPALQGMDWSSLKLVFEADSDGWYLVGVVHGQWTI